MAEKEKFIKVVDTIDVYGKVEEVNSIIIVDRDWWRTNKYIIYNLLEENHLNPDEIHQGYILKFPNEKIMERVAEGIDVLLEKIDNNTIVNESNLKKCSQCGK